MGRTQELQEGREKNNNNYKKIKKGICQSISPAICYDMGKTCRN